MISFQTKDVAIPQLDFAQVESWLQAVAAHHKKKIGRLNYLFCDDEEILRVNREFLHHDYYTDIITFDYSRGEKVSGDLFISLDTVKSNSKELGETYSSELLRVIAHGLLHLCGIDDKGPGEREIMESQENDSLDIWKSLTEGKTE